MAAQRSAHPTPNRSLKQRTDLALIGLLVGFGIVLLRLAWLQWWHRGQFQRLAQQMQARTIPIPARRGEIRARGGLELASNVEARDLFANPRLVKDPDVTARTIAELFGGDAADYRRRLTAAPRSAFTYLKRGLDREKADAHARELKTRPELSGVDLRAAPRRAYPSGQLAAALIGYVNIDGKGIDGLELLQNRVLSSRDGSLTAQVDARNMVIPGTERQEVDPADGKDIWLTIDPMIQYFAEHEVGKAVDFYHAESGLAIVMDVRTGEVLAMANAPGFDPNQPNGAPVANLKCRVVTDTFEPGSIQKVFTAAAALEEHVDGSGYCPGYKLVGAHTIRCAHHHIHGACDLERWLEVSCNICAGTVAERIGAEKLYGHLRDFGLLEKTGVGAQGETRGWLSSWQNWKPVDTFVIGFGQSITVTAMQMIRGYAAIANDGLLLRPRLLDRIDGKPAPPTEAPRRVVSPETARTLRDYMTRVVTGDHGTGHLAKFAHYTVAGKTGTAQIAEHGGYSGYVASFVGFAPASRPRLAILVSVRRPVGGEFGGVVAAPVFREIARQTMGYLRIPPDAPGDERDGAATGSFERWKRQAAGATGTSD